LMVAAVGFQMDPHRDDISSRLPGGKQSGEYARSVSFVTITQWLSLAVPLVVVTCQLLITFDKTKRLIPKGYWPLGHEENVQLAQDFSSAVGAKGPLQSILLGLDSMEILMFWKLMAHSSNPMLGMMDLRSRMSPLARSCSEFVDMLHSGVDSSSRTQGSISSVISREEGGDMVDADDGTGKPNNEPQDAQVKEKADEGSSMDTTSQLKKLRRELEAAAAKLSGGDVERELKEVNSVDGLLLEAIRQQQQQ